MRRGAAVNRVVGAVNAAVVALIRAPWLGRRMGRKLAVVSYVGRRSGRAFSLPVEYRRTGDQITIGVQFPGAKNWWRNFEDAGGPLSLRIDGVDHPGHAVARRDEHGRVTVTVRLATPRSA